MDHGDDAALAAVQHMQQAVDLLHRHKTGGSLQQDISRALQVGDRACSACACALHVCHTDPCRSRQAAEDAVCLADLLTGL